MADEVNSNQEQVKQPEKPDVSGNGASGEAKTYSQSDLDRMFADRAGQAERSLLKKLGFEKAEDAEAVIKKAREAEEAQKSELQKAVDKAAALEKEREGLLAAQKAKAAQYDVAVKAAKIGIVDPDAAYKLLDQSKIEFDANGNATNTEALLKELLAEKPYLAGGGSSAANPAKNREESDPFLKALLKDLPDKKK